MADAWNGSWGTSWGMSWGTGLAPIVIPQAGWDTSDPLFYNWWRRQAKRKDEPDPPPELIAEVTKLISAPITQRTKISPALVRALVGQTVETELDAKPTTSAIYARAIAELQRIADEIDNEDEAIMLVMLQ